MPISHPPASPPDFAPDRASGRTATGFQRRILSLRFPEVRFRAAREKVCVDADRDRPRRGGESAEAFEVLGVGSILLGV